MKIRLLLTRHGLTDWNSQNRFQGQSDIPLNDFGLKQAQALGKRLAEVSIDQIYSSDLDRARHTALAIASYHECPVDYEPALRELNFGEWEGLTYQQIQVKDPQAFDAWNANMLGYAPPGGETLEQLADRISTFLEDLSMQHSEETVLLVAHGGSLQVLFCLALDLSPRMYWQFHFSQASLSELRLYLAGAIIKLLNDTCHLESIMDGN